jgi:hypothetical protein
MYSCTLMLTTLLDALREIDLLLYTSLGEQNVTRVNLVQCKCGEPSMKQLQPIDGRTE